MNGARVRTSELLDYTGTLAEALLSKCVYPWQAVAGLREFICELSANLPKDEYEQILPGVWVARDAVIAPSAYIAEAAIIGHGVEIRHCAYIRGSALICDNAVVGNSTELKNCILLNNAQAPHYNYIGDSALGRGAHMGAGAITSNLKGDKSNVCIHAGGEHIQTGMRKLGAIIGDNAEIGCGAVLNPGAIIGRDTQVYPLCSVRGCVPEDSILKNDGSVCARENR